MMRYKLTILLIFVCTIASAQTKNEPQPQRQYLTGNWNGARDSLKKNGISFQPRVTFFYQGTDVDHAEFAGKADLKANFNGVKIGMPKWTLFTQLEQNFGKTINGSGGLAMPQNMALYQPGMDSNTFDITSLYIMFSPSKSTTIMLGKINMIEMAAGARFMGGAGIDAFTNPVFVAAPTGIIPPYLLGSIISVKAKRLKYTVMVFDPESLVNKSGFETTPFKNISISLQADLPVTIGGMPGAHSVKAIFSTKDGADLYHLNDINLPIQDSAAPPKKSRYFFNYSFNQYLVKYDEEGSGWGIFGQASISDGNPNAIYTTLYVGLGGNSFIKSRKQDRWGLAYFNYRLGNGLVEYSATKMIYLGHETGADLFYNVNFTPWFSLAADFQLGKSVVKAYDQVFTWGLRSRVLL